MPLPATLLVAYDPAFPIRDVNGIVIEIAGLDPSIDPVVFVDPRNAGALMRWGEQHAAAILANDAIALRERQFFLHRGLMMQAMRLFNHRARFKRLGRLIQVFQTTAMFLSAQPSTYAATLSMRPPAYNPAGHAVGTSLLAAGLHSWLHLANQRSPKR